MKPTVFYDYWPRERKIEDDYDDEDDDEKKTTMEEPIWAHPLKAWLRYYSSLQH